ncbi:MAG: DUF4913 domain-containing protein [Solirubrobacteraceae bacterium]
MTDAGLGEWGDANGPAPRSAIAAVIASVDLDASVQDAVQSAMRRRLDAVAATAVDEVLDEPTLAQLREAADDAARAALLAPAVPGAGVDDPPELYYPDVVAFVREQLVPMYRRPLGGQGVTWCPQWWRHAEAIARLEALWRAWEHLRLDPATGMSVWFRDHADHHMPVLLSADGPFKGCKPDKHGERLDPLPLDPPPDGLF